MGETVLSFHIHAGTDTCDGCEPGQVMAHLSKHQRNQPLQTGSEQPDYFADTNVLHPSLNVVCIRPNTNAMLTHLVTHATHMAQSLTSQMCCSSGPAPTKEDKELLRQKELKQMKVKYGLKVSDWFIHHHYNFILLSPSAVMLISDE